MRPLGNALSSRRMAQSLRFEKMFPPTVYGTGGCEARTTARSTTFSSSRTFPGRRVHQNSMASAQW